MTTRSDGFGRHFRPPPENDRGGQKNSSTVLDMASQDVITPLASGGDTPRRSWTGRLQKSLDARIAQLVEQRIENPRVGGSNPPPGTIQPQTDLLYFIACLLDRGFAAGILRLT